MSASRRSPDPAIIDALHRHELTARPHQQFRLRAHTGPLRVVYLIKAPFAARRDGDLCEP